MELRKQDTLISTFKFTGYDNYINSIMIYQRIWCNISENRRHECLSIYKNIEHTSFKEILDYIKCNMYYCVVLYIDIKYKKFI